MDTKRAVESIGEMLTAFLRSGPESARHSEEVQRHILNIVHDTVVSPEDSTKSYKKKCDDFLRSVVKARGLPIRRVFEVDEVTPSGRAESKRGRGKRGSALPMSELRF